MARSRSPDGLAVVDHSALDRAPFESSVEVLAHVGHPSVVIGAKASFLSFEGGPVRLVLPGSGRVTVRLHAAGGVQVGGSAHVELLARDPTAPRSGPLIFSAPAPGGVATFAGVPAAGSPSGAGAQGFRDGVASESRFRLTGVAPGMVRLLIRLAEGPDLASVAEVDVPRLGAASDTRVRSIDLRTHAALR